MVDIEGLRRDAGEISEKVQAARETMAAAGKAEKEAEAACTAAAAAAYLDAGSPGAEEEARARLVTARAEIDRLKRIIPVAEARLREVQAAIVDAERAEARAAVQAGEREIDALFARLLEKHLEADGLGDCVVDVLERVRPAYERLGQAVPDPWPKFRQMQEQERRRRPKLIRL